MSISKTKVDYPLRDVSVHFISKLLFNLKGNTLTRPGLRPGEFENALDRPPASLTHTSRAERGKFWSPI